MRFVASAFRERPVVEKYGCEESQADLRRKICGRQTYPFPYTRDYTP